MKHRFFWTSLAIILVVAIGIGFAVWRNHESNYALGDECASPPSIDQMQRYSRKIEDENRYQGRSLQKLIEYARLQVLASCENIHSWIELVELHLEAGETAKAIAALESINRRGKIMFIGHVSRRRLTSFIQTSEFLSSRPGKAYVETKSRVKAEMAAIETDLESHDALLKAKLRSGQLPNELSDEGFGPIRLGMTLTELEENLKEEAKDKNEIEKGCSRPSFQSLPGISLLVEKGRVTRIYSSEVLLNKYSLRQSDSLDAFKLAHPELKSENHHYSPGHMFYLDSGDGRRTFIIEEVEGKVTSVGAGLYRAARYPEGCL